MPDSTNNQPRLVSLIAGSILAAAGLVASFVVMLGFARVEDFGVASRAGAFLVGILGPLAIGVPLYAFAEALVLFLPGFRKDLLYYVTASVVPFSVLVILNSFLRDPETWFATVPAARALGVPLVGIFGGVLFLGTVLLVIAVRELARGTEADRTSPVPADRDLDAPASSVPASRTFNAGASSVPGREPFVPASLPGSPDSTGDSGAFEFSAPELPPLPELKTSALSDARPVPASETSDDAGAGILCPQTAESVQAGDRGLESAPSAQPGDGGSDGVETVSAGAPDIVPVFFPKRDAPAAAAVVETAVADAEPSDPAASGAFWADVRDADGDRGSTDTLETARSLVRGKPGERSDPTRPLDRGGAATRTESSRPLSPAADRPPALVVESVPPERHAPPRKKLRTEYFVPTDILNAYPDGEYWVIDEKTRHKAAVLQETLAEFNIEAEVTGIRKGPVVTMFEILPAPGVKLSKIVNLADNIALRLAASTVRIVAPIPGKHAVGIEVPNERRAIVSFREIVESDGFRSAKMEIPVALGKDISGEVQVIDLVQTPHLLIAGATGSGKSVCVNALILSLLYRRSQNEVRLLLIDPKIVELKLYNDIPHLLTQVITEPKKAFQALQYCICEMERRYSMLDRLGVRDIRSFNRKVDEKKLAQEKIPYLVVVIDEFADLMATTGKELESTLARLAAMSRAVGIHLVLATQRPSIDVITGLIKANIPSRIAFMVAGKFDSRIIIDSVGAEKLLGKGDMLFSSAWDPFPVRMQGAYVSEEEVERVVEKVKEMGEPDYIDDEIFFDEEEENEEPSLFDEDADDPLFEKALEIVLQQGKASASFIQRRLKIGYNRSARLVELMEEKGIVGPAQGSKPRDLVRNPGLGSLPGRGADAGSKPVPNHAPSLSDGGANPETDEPEDVEELEELDEVDGEDA